MYTNHPDVIALAKRAFPDYTGKKFQVTVQSTPLDVRSYWEGGSRSYFKFLRLDGQKGEIDVPQQSAFDAKVEGADAVTLVPGLACVEHTIFCGKDVGICIYIHPDNAPKFLPESKVDLTEDETIVLYYTRSIRSPHRFSEAVRNTGISADRWDAAKISLISHGMLNRVGSLTIDGKNAASQLKRGNYFVRGIR